MARNCGDTGGDGISVRWCRRRGGISGVRGTVGDVGLASADEGVGEGENVRWRGRRGMVSMLLRVWD